MATIDAFKNWVNADLKTNAGEKAPSLGSMGLINTQWTVDNTDKSKQYEIDYQKEDSTVIYSPTSTQYTIPIITMSGSEVRDTGNTAYTQPSTFTPAVSQAANATHQDEEKTGES